MSFNGQVVKPIVVHPCHGILLSNKKKQTGDMGNNMMNVKGMMLSEKSNPSPPQSVSLWSFVCIMIQTFSNHLEAQDFLWGNLTVESPDDQKAAESLQLVINK